MPFPFALVGLGLSALSAGANIYRSLKGFPDFPLTSADVNREIDLAMNRALSEAASGTRRRLIGAGQEGSSTINVAIQDIQSRIRTMFEEQRQRALNLLAQAQHNRDIQSFNQLTNMLGQLSNIGFSTFALGGGLGQRQEQYQPFNTLMNIAPLFGVRTGTMNLQQNLAQPVQPLQLRPAITNLFPLSQ